MGSPTAKSTIQMGHLQRGEGKKGGGREREALRN